MSLWNWGCICFLGSLISIGLPLKAKSEVATEETRPTTVKECRVHIEKALEQYWEVSEPQETPSKLSDGNYQSEHDNNEEEETPFASRETRESDKFLRKLEDTVRKGSTDDTSTEENTTQNTKSYSQNGLSEDDGEDDEENDEDDNEDDNEEDDEDCDDDTNGSPDNGEIPQNKIVESINSALKDPIKPSRIHFIKRAKPYNDKDNGEMKSDDTTESLESHGESQEPSDSQTNYKKISIENTADKLKNDNDSNNKEIENNIKGNVEENKADDDNKGEDDHNKDAEGDENKSDNDMEDDDEDEEDGSNEEKDNSDGKEDIDEDDDEEEADDSDEDDDDNEKNTEDRLNEADDDDDRKTEDDEIYEKNNTLNESYANESLNISFPSNDSLKDGNKTVPIDLDTPATAIEFASEKAENDTFHVSEKIDQKDSVKNKELPKTLSASTNDTDEAEEFENIYEEDIEVISDLPVRKRGYIDVILGLDDVGSDEEKEEEKLAQSVFKEIKKIEMTHIKPIEQLYKYGDSTTRVLGDAEVFNKPMILFLGPWGTGKTSIINYILGIENTPSALKTGTGITDVDFTLLTCGKQRRIISGTELAADWRYSGVQKFGQGFLDHFRSIQMTHSLLEKVTIIDTPGILENRKNTERGYSFNDAFQWFIERADAIYVVLDSSKVDVGRELGSVIELLKDLDVRFILNKADTIRRSDLMRVVGQLFWNLSPLMSNTEAPIIYALTTFPYPSSAPARFLEEQEKNFILDIKRTLENRVENRILYARKHAVRVRNHAKMVDCYLASYYRHKSIFSSKRNVAKLITDSPREYDIYNNQGIMTNISSYDLPSPQTYKEFFKLHPLYDFKTLASTCSYFRGCPMDKLDLAIAVEFPELLAKYKKAKSALYQEFEKSLGN